MRWEKLLSLPLSQYKLPTGSIGRSFVSQLIEELKGIQKRKWNFENI